MEEQLSSGPLFLLLHGKTDGVQHQIHCLLGPCVICHDSVVVQVSDYVQLQDALPGMDIRNIRYPLGIGPIRTEVPVQQILVLMYLLPHLRPLSPASYFRQQSVLLHEPQHGLRVAVDILAFYHSHIRR